MPQKNRSPHTEKHTCCNTFSLWSKFGASQNCFIEFLLCLKPYSHRAKANMKAMSLLTDELSFNDAIDNRVSKHHSPSLFRLVCLALKIKEINALYALIDGFLEF